MNRSPLHIKFRLLQFFDVRRQLSTSPGQWGTSPRVSEHLSVAEQEWLQDEQVLDSTLHPDLISRSPPKERFDWRLRAPSRTRTNQQSLFMTRSSNPIRYVRRKIPPLTAVTQDEALYDAIKAYEHHFSKLLAAEEAEAEAILNERLSSWSVDRLKSEGYCLTGLSAFWLQANQFGRPVASFSLGPGVVLPEHRFENGTQVLVSRIDPLQETPVKGSIICYTSSQIKVSFVEPFDLEDGEWRLDVGQSNLVYDRMRHAISHLHHDPQTHEDAGLGPDYEYVLQGTHLRDMILRSFDPSSADDQLVASSSRNASTRSVFESDMRIQSWARRYSELDPLVVEGDPILEDLNATQRRAVAMMIRNNFSLVQGPPGTGKTKTIIETVRLLKAYFEVPYPILVCTYTNVAVDNLVEGLVAAKVKALRVGFGGNIRTSILNHTLEYKLENHPLKSTLDDLTKKEQELSNRMTDLQSRLECVRQKQKDGESKPAQRGDKMQMALLSVEGRHRTLRSRIYALRQQMLQDVLTESDVICTTCITSACVALNMTDFPVVFLDEASMSTEPASLIPLMKGSRHVALIGDHKQLPPVITSREAQALGLGVSLFERLTQEGGLPSIMLDVQYRMHPSISRFPSLEFYNLGLQDGTVDEEGNISSLLLPPTSQHLRLNAETGRRPSVIFLDHGGMESLKDRSRVNHDEARIVVSVVEDLLLNNPELRGRDIGIIAPYLAQISLLNRLFKTDVRYRAQFKEVLGEHRAMQLASLEIKTVDGFEGREKDVIIFSTVRNNGSGYLGFLADQRRLNVGLTRAKRGLFIIGNINTLRTGKMGRTQTGYPLDQVARGAESWRRYAKYLSEQGLVVSLTGDALQRALYHNVVSARGVLQQHKS